MKFIFLLFSHGAVLGIGFALGVYFLPILTAPKSANLSQIEQVVSNPVYKAEFKKGQRGNDFFHWGEGQLVITNNEIALKGKVAPGPDYKIYLTKKFVEHEDEFLPIKQNALYVADLKVFENFIVPLDKKINFEDYNTIIIWCEAFKEFITSAKYKSL
ncbi:DM13 domain-containing protein [Candidatus Pelagibacter sp. HIMB109]|uniref:DM13 domain-containing protein n=1 Tax=Candidatus Pelagibacter sp. HIMB109 TaxID=3415412 RepID=UPI003F83F6B2